MSVHHWKVVWVATARDIVSNLSARAAKKNRSNAVAIALAQLLHKLQDTGHIKQSAFPSKH